MALVLMSEAMPARRNGERLAAAAHRPPLLRIDAAEAGAGDYVD